MISVSMLQNIRIVLVNPSHPGNVGGVARAMKTMNLTSLVLVNPKRYPDAEAAQRAVGAEDVLERARIVGRMSEGVGDCSLVVGTTARTRSVVWPALTPAAAADRLLDQAADGPVALVFGCERTGLSNREVELCHFLVHIPTNPEFTSLNLASAVQLLAYELFLRTQSTPARTVEEFPLATMEQMRLFYEHLETVLDDISFPKAHPPTRLMRKLKRLFNRAQPTHEEIQLLRGILTAVRESARRP